MKTLDVDALHNGIDQVIETLSSQKEQLQQVKLNIQAVIHLDDSFTGSGGGAIRSFYQDCHLPFLAFFQAFAVEYESVLGRMKAALQALEPAQEGFIRQSYLEQEVSQGIEQLKTVTMSLTNDANQAIRRVRDIVALPDVNDEPVLLEAGRAKRHMEDTVEQLYHFDQQQTEALTSVGKDIQLMTQYVKQVEAIFTSKVHSLAFLTNQVKRNLAYSALLTNLQNKTKDLYSLSAFSPFNGGYINHPYWTDSLYMHYAGLRYADQQEYRWQLYSTMMSCPRPTMTAKVEDEEEGRKFLIGNESEPRGGFSAAGGVGYYDHNWTGISEGFHNSDLPIGGSSQFTGVYAGFDLDTSIVDGTYAQRMADTELKASIGGPSIFPIVKAEGTVLRHHARVQADSDIPVIGRTGVEGDAKILTAKGYAGVDNASVGVAAKAAVIEGDVSGILPIPFTDWNAKVTAGASGGSIGGEAKIGKETMLDLRFVIGVKLGLSFERQIED
ncbi:LXG domain-containing protein [Halalkalibacter oceani]|uniref:LXG domain-containing protein n=1 Tax=Halalkalibacter oceani TaxID=1653776 RepID=UPI003390A4EA